MARSDQERLLSLLQSRGGCSSQQIQQALRLSQPSVSRLLATVSDSVLALGKGRQTRYALAEPIAGGAAQRSIWSVDEAGRLQRLGALSLLARGQIHIAADGLSHWVDARPGAELPWYLMPLRAQGFMARTLVATSLSGLGLDANPQRWDVQQILTAALHLDDVPGSLLLGEPVLASGLPQLPSDPSRTLDGCAQHIAQTLPAGSSAAGEQPKFLARRADGAAVLVKFAPPTGTPFGQRWHDLLHAEALSSQVLRAHGFPAAPCQVVETTDRTFLLSERFDRVGARGRRHVVTVGDAHAGWVTGAYQNWMASCDALAAQGRLPAEQALAVRDLFQFGRLIGNTDMHSGNCSLYVSAASLSGLARGRFTLAPTYDMLPMRWRPDAQWGLPDYAPFAVDTSYASARAVAAAADYWSRLAQLGAVSPSLRSVAADMARQLPLV